MKSQITKIVSLLVCVCLVVSGMILSTSAAEPATTEIVLTVDSLGIPSNSYDANTKTISDVGFEWIQIGNYGDGIQVRDKNGNTSSLWNTTAFPTAIKEIKLTYSDTKDVTYDNPNCAIYSFGNAAGTYTAETKLSTANGVKEYTITPDAQTYTFFKFEHDLGYTQYWKSITIVLAPAASDDNQGGTNNDDNQGGTNNDDNQGGTNNDDNQGGSNNDTNNDANTNTGAGTNTDANTNTNTNTGSTTTTPAPEKSPETGDSIALYIVMMAISAAAMVLVAKKRFA